MTALLIGVLLLTAATSASGVSAAQRMAPRLLTNPFGLLGHSQCIAKFNDQYLAGSCYNEVECLVRGGQFTGYCGSAAIGVCCVFVVSRCEGARLREITTYVTNPAFPQSDGEPAACLVRIKAQPEVCWIRLDFESLEMKSTPEGNCDVDWLTVLNGGGGPGGRICGFKSGYSSMVRVTQDANHKDKDHYKEKLHQIALSFVVQSKRYKWNIRVTQIKCKQVLPVPQSESCGLTGASGFARQSLLAPPNLVAVDNSSSRVIVRKRVVASGGSLAADQLCHASAGDAAAKACHVVRSALQSNDRKLRTDAEEDIPVKSTSQASVLRKRLYSEAYYPAFTAKSVFCTSKFRQSEFATAKIVDGSESSPHAFPWIVSLQLNGSHFCGGSLITDRFVLAAAHCVEFGDMRDFFERLMISLGDHDLSVSNETASITRGVSGITFYPGWYNAPGSSGDVALLRLDRPVEVFGADVAPVCLPLDLSQTFESMVAVAAGWGITEDGEASDVLRQVELNIISQTACAQNLETINVRVTEDMICTLKGPTGSESICTGDSGGPLMIRSAGRFVLVGVTSFSVTDCTAPFPAVFARVTHFLDWIAAVISTS